jgi:hypothetical protein
VCKLQISFEVLISGTYNYHGVLMFNQLLQVVALKFVTRQSYLLVPWRLLLISLSVCSHICAYIATKVLTPLNIKLKLYQFKIFINFCRLLHQEFP